MRKEILPQQIQANVFAAIGQQWMLVTAGNRDNANTMTASWGGLGVLWGKNVATIYVRPQRYTYEFLEQSDYFTLCFFSEDYRKELALCGAKSGREIDKVNECGFSIAYGQGDAPYVQEAQLVLVCRKLYHQDFEPQNFIDPTIGEHYPQNDYHRQYIGEIVTVLEQG